MSLPNILILSYFKVDSTNVGSFRVSNLYYKLGKKYKIKFLLIKDYNLEKNYRRLHKYCTIIDINELYIIFKLSQIYKYCKNENIKIVYMSGPPFSLFLAGYYIKKKLKIKLILDYRDPWHIYPRGKNLLIRKINYYIDKEILNKCDCAIFNTEKSRKYYTRKIPCIKNKSFVITNGYDEILDNVDDLDSKFFIKDINIIYAGNLYGSRRLRYLFAPIYRLMKENYFKKDELNIHFFGNKISGEDRDSIINFNFEDIVTFNPPIPRKSIYKVLKLSTLLYLPQGKDFEYSIPYKFYDYLCVKRPILAVTSKDSAIAEVMSEVDCGELAYIDDENSIYNGLKKIIVYKKSYKFNDLDKYSWDNLINKFIYIIQKKDA